MARVVVDLSNFRDRSGARIPEGDYLAVVDDIEVGESRTKKVMWTVYFRIIGGEYDGLTIPDRLTQTEAAMFRTVAFLNGLGIKTPRKKISVDLGRLVGRRVLISVADGEPYRGTIRSEVRQYMRYVPKTEAAEDLPDEDISGDLPEDVPEEVEEVAEVKVKSEASTGPNPWDDGAETVDDLGLDLDDLDI